jgi:hypothetical protein
MRCTACGSELVLTSVVPDETARLRDCEYHTFVCSSCHSTEHRLVSTRHGRENDSLPVPDEVVRGLALARSAGVEPAASRGLLGRMVAWLRRH